MLQSDWFPTNRRSPNILLEEVYHRINIHIEVKLLDLSLKGECSEQNVALKQI